MEVDKEVYEKDIQYEQDLTDFYLKGIPTFDFQVEEKWENQSCEFWLELNHPSK